MKCKSCGAEMEKVGNTKFGDVEYDEYKCSTCNTKDYRAISVKGPE